MATSIGQQLVSAVEALSKLSAEAITSVVGIWLSASTAIRTVATGIAAAATMEEVNTARAKYQSTPLSPADLADMVIRNIGNTDEHFTEAQLSGLSAERFSLLVEDTGESYGIVDALRLWHRGLYLGPQYGISEAELDTVIYYSRVRDQFIPDLKLLAYATMSAADAIGIAVKEIVPPEQTQAWWAAAGGMPEQYEPVLEAAGDSVGVEHAVALAAHGVITEAELDAVIAQSRINPRFYGVARMANLKWLAPYQIERAVQSGQLDPQTALQWLVQEGYSPEQAAVFSVSAAQGNIHAAKAETEAIILADYEAQIITEADATTGLAQLGYQPFAITFILEAVVAKRVITMRNAAITRLRSAYISHLVDATFVSTELATLGIPQAAIAQMLDAWSIEQATQVKRLSMAQVGKLVEEALITAANAVQRWVDMGYPPEEAQLLLAIYPPASKAAPGTQPVTTVTTGTATVEGT